MWAVALLCFLTGLVGTSRAQDAFRGKVTEVEQGNQVTVQLDTWKLRVRLHGVENPKSLELALLARAWTRARLEDQQVQVGVRGTAAKGIVYGDVSALPGEHNIGIELVEQGLATWSERYAPLRRDLRAAQARAQRARAGVWGTSELEVIRLQRSLRALSAPAAPPLPRKATPAPPSPPPPNNSRPQKNFRPQRAPEAHRAASPWPLLIGLLGAVGLIVVAERVSRDARSLRRRPTLLADLPAAPQGKVKLRGLVQSNVPPVVSIAGKIPGVYLHEVTQIYRDGAWRTTYDETDTIPIVLEDGSGRLSLAGEALRYLPIRVARFYNDIPVERWHANSYGGDIRTEVFFIPADVTVVVFGELTTERKQPLLVIEGDERRLTHLPVRLALGLIVGAVVALLLGGYATVVGGG